MYEQPCLMMPSHARLTTCELNASSPTSVSKLSCLSRFHGRESASLDGCARWWMECVLPSGADAPDFRPELVLPSLSATFPQACTGDVEVVTPQGQRSEITSGPHPAQTASKTWLLSWVGPSLAAQQTMSAEQEEVEHVWGEPVTQTIPPPTATGSLGTHPQVMPCHCPAGTLSTRWCKIKGPPVGHKRSSNHS